MNIDELIKDLLEADSTMSKSELLTHCQIISAKNGVSDTELNQAFNNNSQVKEMKD